MTGDPLPPDRLTDDQCRTLLEAVWATYRKSGSAVRLGHALKINWPTDAPDGPAARADDR